MIWSQSLYGKAIDLVNPRVDQVDFREIAETLAGTYRWAGSSASDISVALHTLIVFDAAPDEAKPYALLHDAHEARLGDITRPAQAALQTIAGQIGGPAGPDTVRSAIATMKRRHDRVIWSAAGLPLPGEGIHLAVHAADLVALMTERRDFLRAPPLPWDHEHIAPLPKVYRWRSKAVVATELYEKFKQYLPALQA